MGYNNIEIEAKVIIDENTYKKLKENFKYGKKVTQTNYYIDNDSRTLKNEKIALRIRHLNNEFTLTLKTPMSEGLLEKNQILSGEEALAMIGENVFPAGDIHDFLELLDVNVSTLKIQAKLQTERIEIDYKTGMVALDKNTYGKDGSVTDYELESNDSSMAQAKCLAEEILEPLNIKVKFNDKSKQTRALEAIENNK